MEEITEDVQKYLNLGTCSLMWYVEKLLHPSMYLDVVAYCAQCMENPKDFSILK